MTERPRGQRRAGAVMAWMLCALLAGGPLAACSHRAAEEGQVAAMWRDLRIEISGTLTEKGRCGVIEDSEGRRYGVVGNLRRYEPGDRLLVAGPVAYWSGCGTYSAVKAERVEGIR